MIIINKIVTRIIFVFLLAVYSIEYSNANNSVKYLKITSDPREVIFKSDFMVANKAYQIFVERIANSGEGSGYEIKILYQPHSQPVPKAGQFINSQGMIYTTGNLIGISDREAFVASAMAALERVQSKVPTDNTTVEGLTNHDAPFATSASPDVREAFQNELRNQFEKLQIQQVKLSSAPLAGTGRVFKLAKVYMKEFETKKVLHLFKKEVKSPRDVGDFQIDSIQIEIEDGNILNLKAHGVIKKYEKEEKEFYLFESQSPIGISTIGDLNQWYDVKLYSQARRRDGDKNYYVFLADLFRYYPNLNPRTSDFSPADGVYTLHPLGTSPQRSFYKVETSKILQARIYSDLAGVDQDRPNGLIQIELSKKFILYNKSYSRSRLLQFGWLNYFDTFLTISKIEEHNKFLGVKSMRMNDSTITTNSIKTIDLVKYTNFLIGTDVNLLYFYFPAIKYNLFLNGRMQINRVALRDSLYRMENINNELQPVFKKMNESRLNVVVYGLGLRGVVRPDSRYGAEFRLDWNRYSIAGNTYKQDPPIQGKTVLKKFVSQDVFQNTAIFWAKVSDHGELFFRPQFTYMRKHNSQNYFQVQVGYQFDVFSPNRAQTPVKKIF